MHASMDPTYICTDIPALEHACMNLCTDTCMHASDMLLLNVCVRTRTLACLCALVNDASKIHQGLLQAAMPFYIQRYKCFSTYKDASAFLHTKIQVLFYI